MMRSDAAHDLMGATATASWLAMLGTSRWVSGWNSKSSRRVEAMAGSLRVACGDPGEAARKHGFPRIEVRII